MTTRPSFALAATPVVLAALVVSAAGCDTNFWDPSRFPPLRSQAQIHITVDPGAGPFPTARYGAVVTGYTTLLPEQTVVIPGARAPGLLSSRFVIAGGPSSGWYVYRGFEDHAISDTATTGLRPIFDTSAVYDECRTREECGDGAGASLAAFDVYPGGLTGGGDDFSCVVAPGGAVGLTGGGGNERLLVHCETDLLHFVALDVPDGVDYGASGTGIPAIRGDGCAPRPHPVGVALFGAPRANSQDGALYVLRAPPAFENVELDLGGVTLPANASLGATIAALPLDDTRLLVAVGARSDAALSDPMVLVMTLTGSPAGVTTEVHACLGGTGSLPGFGRALAIGDLDGDDSPEIVVGGGARAPGASGDLEEPISIFSYASLASLRLAGCDGGPPPIAIHEFECDDVSDLMCADASIAGRPPIGFGASLAIGDIDGDGTGDLVVGAPHAVVRGIRSGTIVSLAGDADLGNLGVGEGNQASLALTNGRAGMLFGYAVSTILGTDREEILVGAPGARQAAVVFCSGLMGDRAQDLVDTMGLTRGCVVPMSGGRPARCTGGTDAGVPFDAGGMSFDAGEADAGVPDDVPLDADEDAFVDPARDAP